MPERRRKPLSTANRSYRRLQVCCAPDSRNGYFAAKDVPLPLCEKVQEALFWAVEAIDDLDDVINGDCMPVAEVE